MPEAAGNPMTVRPEDVEPEDARARAAPAPATDWRTDPSFRWPERVPWSVLGPDFMDAWAGPPRGKREHLEIVGPTGSGKSHLMLTALQDKYRFDTARAGERGKIPGAVLVVTKADDDVFSKLGWPVVHSAADIRDTHVVFWPRTKKTGLERRAYHEAHVSALLDKAWQPNNTVIAFDEVGYVESLSGNLRATVQHYWREGRSMGIQVVGMKQRPQGALRDMHSETFWTAAFAPNDRSDLERFAELFGHRRDWMPVFDDLDPEAHEFVLRHSRSKEAYISWVDTPLTPQKIKRSGLRTVLSR
jgi:hypothetical protein